MEKVKGTNVHFRVYLSYYYSGNICVWYHWFLLVKTFHFICILPWYNQNINKIIAQNDAQKVVIRVMSKSVIFSLIAGVGKIHLIFSSTPKVTNNKNEEKLSAHMFAHRTPSSHWSNINMQH